MSKTIKVKAGDLTGVALDWAVASAMGVAVIIDHQGWVREPGHCAAWRPSADWSQAGPIIERERMSFSDCIDCFSAASKKARTMYGPSHLIAAMRCYVAAKLGDEIEVPAELVEGGDA